VDIIMRADFLPAIEAFKKMLAEQERKVLETKAAVNALYVAAGEPAPYSLEAEAQATASLTSIKPDTFYGKSINTAAREYLEMRKAAGDGPATPRDVYEALSRGGLKFETKDETNAIIGVRATLRKNSSVFHRLPTGDYGLLEWYPNAKAPKESESSASRGAKAKKHKKAVGASGKKQTAAPPDSNMSDRPPKGEKQTVAMSIENVMRGKDDFMKIPEIVEALAASGTPLKGTNPATHVGSVLSRGKQFYSEKGKGWKLQQAVAP
jgi:hypothetical protein